MEKSQEIHTLPMELGKSPVERLTWFYIKVLKNKMGTNPVVNYGMADRKSVV